MKFVRTLFFAILLLSILKFGLLNPTDTGTTNDKNNPNYNQKFLGDSTRFKALETLKTGKVQYISYNF